MIEAKMTGVDELTARLQTISDDMKKKGGRYALRKASEIVRDAAKAGAERLDDPETGRSIARNIAMRWSNRTFKRTGNLMFRIGVMHGAKISGSNEDQGANGPTPHWRLLEFGTEKMAAQPFMRPAASNNVQQVVDTFVTQYGKALDRALARAKKAGG